MKRSKLKLEDFDFLKEKDILGKGAYGEVKLVKFKKT